MTDAEVRAVADALRELVRPVLQQSPALRTAAQRIGQWLIEQSRDARPEEGSSSQPASNATAAEPRTAEPPRRAPAPIPSGSLHTEMVPLRLGDASTHVRIAGTSEEFVRVRHAIEARPPAEPTPVHTLDLDLVRIRSRLKADSCRLFIRKRAAEPGSEEEAALRTRMDEMIAEAKALPKCFLWVFWRAESQPDDDTLRQIADNYEAHARATELMLQIDQSGARNDSDEVEAAMHLLAEANSALRVALRACWLRDDDNDQSDVHYWLRRETAARQVYIVRHMTVQDPADPALAQDRIERIRDLAARFAGRARREKQVRELLGKIRYHASRTVRAEAETAAEDWHKVAAAVASLADLGVASSDRRIAEHLSPQAAAACPSELADLLGLAAVLQRVLGQHADEPNDDTDTDSTARAWSEHVLQVRSLLRGRRMVIVGGERYPHAERRIIEAFELADADWVELTEHGSGAPMRGPILRPDTAVVIVIIKLTGHLHSEEAREYCRSADKPVVFLTGGYSPERIAMAVLEQASERLRRMAG